MLMRIPQRCSSAIEPHPRLPRRLGGATHVAIFGSAMKYMMAQDTAAQPRLCHEVFRGVPGRAAIRVSGLSSGTGLLGNDLGPACTTH